MGKVLLACRLAARDMAISASGGTGHSTTPADLVALTKLIGAPGVTGHTGPYPAVWAALRVHGVCAGVMAEGRNAAPAPIAWSSGPAPTTSPAARRPREGADGHG